ncbi:MAG: glycosyltransferase family 4 protein [Candidatus Hadarchaeales archaeon]
MWITFGKWYLSKVTCEFLEKEKIQHLHLPSVSFRGEDVPLFLKRIRADVILGLDFFYVCNFLLRLRTKGTFYSITSENHLAGFSKRFWIPIANSMFKGVIVPVKSTKIFWEQLGLKNVFVVPLAADLGLFKYQENRLSEKLKILFVGRITPEKGIDYLLRAVSLLKIPYSLTLVGDGRIDYYQGLAQRLGCEATFLGPADYEELPKIYHEHNVLVLPSITTPSWKEQFGRVLVEAMATGRVVIGSNSGAIPEVIGNAGYVVSREIR